MSKAERVIELTQRVVFLPLYIIVYFLGYAVGYAVCAWKGGYEDGRF